MSAEEERFAQALGQAVISSWGSLPQEIQHLLFEKAVIAGHHTERDESLREQLAAFLHERHPRTG
jgi:hypothetical protein